MTERTALFLAHLSHQWFLMVLSLPIVCGVATYYVGGWWTHARANTPARRFSLVLRVVSYVPLLLSCVLVFVAFLHIGCAVVKSHSSDCMSNMKQLSTEIMMYANDYDERLPASIAWAEAIDPNVSKVAVSNLPSGHDVFQCPAAESPASYGMNVLMGNKTLSDMNMPANTVLLFDANAPIRSFAGGKKMSLVIGTMAPQYDVRRWSCQMGKCLRF